MTLRQRRQHHHKPPCGTLFALVAVAIQALIPFFLAVQIAHAANPAVADSNTICSVLNHQNNGTSNPPANGKCPICAAVAAGLAFSAPLPLGVALPRHCDRADLAVPPPHDGFSFVAPAYRSRGPPAIT